MRSATRLTLNDEERQQFLKNVQKFVDERYPTLSPLNESRRQGDLCGRMADEIARRWDDLGLYYDEACGLYNAEVMQTIYMLQLGNSGAVKRWTHKRSCEKWERQNLDVMKFMFQLITLGVNEEGRMDYL